MKSLVATLLASLVLAPMFTVPALAQSKIATLDRGQYVCELPGSAASHAGIAQPEENFRIESASQYSAPEGDGTYLRRGDRVMMTSGPRNGVVYVLVGRNFLRKIEGGEPGRLRCIRQSR